MSALSAVSAVSAVSSTCQVVNPATGQAGRSYPELTDEQVQDVLARADTAYRSWRTTPRDERTALLNRVADLYDERADELAAVIAREMGKPVREGKGELSLVSDIYRYYASEGPRLLEDEPLTTKSGGTAFVRKEPVGALLGIMPWNYPYYQVARFAAPNLMIGNTVILKHAPQCPESALAMEKVFHDAGLPADAYINAFTTNAQVATMIADPRVVGVSVTGSERAGAAVAAEAGKNLKKVVLELGGSDPFIVLGDADLASTVKAAVLGARRPTSSSARSTTPCKGATVLTGGHRVERPGAFVEATLLTGVTPEMRAYSEELFGPAAVVQWVPDADSAVELANSSAFGLGGVVFTADHDKAVDVANRLETGMVWINSPQGSVADLPFGGTKRSGVGRELGPNGIDEFVNTKLVYTP